MLVHRYGPKVHIDDNPSLAAWLARLCSPDCRQPELNTLVEYLYTSLITTVVAREFPKKKIAVPTRMTAMHPDCLLHTEVPEPKTRVVTVNLARAGTFPSHICYQTLNTLLDPELLRQDHILASRLTGDKDQVTGAQLGSAKIGGDVNNAVVLYPDPMGATGSTLVSAIDYYKTSVGGTPQKIVALHFIVTPEYLKKVTAAHPDLVIYALRVDRGLSPKDVLQTTPGEHWDRERGLNAKQYIVPGGGGFGEVMNNSWV